MMGAFESQKGDEDKKRDDPKNEEPNLPKTLQDFKKADNKYCANGVLSSFDVTKGSVVKLEKSFFTPPSAGSTPSSCLIVNWDKTKYSDGDKWKGNFR